MNMARIHDLLEDGDGTKFVEESYTLTSGQHGPDHPDVQIAGNDLIESLINTRKLVDAERFARINYESIIDPTNHIDRNSSEVAFGKLLLARVWMNTPPNQRVGGPEAAEEAETLAREACDILLENIRSGKESNDYRVSPNDTPCLDSSDGGEWQHEKRDGEDAT
jgi:hypothetical protein